MLTSELFENAIQVDRLIMRVMGKNFEVTAIFNNDKGANQYLENNPEESLIAIDARGLAYIAKNNQF